MSRQMLGAIAGLIFGALTVVMMSRLTFPDKTAALTAAFIERFAIGVVIGCVALPLPGWLIGLGFGLPLSLPSAIITRGYLPIIVMGSLGGLIIGGLIHGWK